MSYTVAQINVQLRSRFPSLAIDDTTGIQFANDANREVCGTKTGHAVWPFLLDVFEGTLTTNEIEYDLPPDCETPYDLILTAPNSDARYIKFLDLQYYRERYPDPTAGTPAMPTVWTRFGQYFKVGPTPPDQDYTLEMPYRKRAKTITNIADTIDIPDEWIETVVLGMARRVLLQRRRYDQAQVLQQEQQELVNNMRDALLQPQIGTNTRNRSGWFRK